MESKGPDKKKVDILRALLKEAKLDYVVTRIEDGTIAHVNIWVGKD